MGLERARSEGAEKPLPGDRAGSLTCRNIGHDGAAGAIRRPFSLSGYLGASMTLDLLAILASSC